MELFCPSCQKKLIIEDQYAGQMMKCPMCQSTFTAPTLPSFEAQASSLPSGAPPAPDAPPPPPVPGSAPPMPPAPSGGLPMPPAPPQFQASPPPAPAYQGFQPGPPPALYQEPVRSTEHTRTCTVWFDPKILQWIPVGAIVAVFLLTFFTWVWIGQGGIGLANQNAWQAAFGGYSLDADLEKDGDPFKKEADEYKPGVSVLSIFFVLLLIPALLLIIAAAVVGFVRGSLPANMQMLLNFRWALAAGLAFLLFFFLTLQLLVGFSMENVWIRKADQSYRDRVEKATNALQKKLYAFERGDQVSDVHRSAALSGVWWLNLIAFLVAGLIFWIDVRKTAPIPKLEFRW